MSAIIWNQNTTLLFICILSGMFLLIISLAVFLVVLWRKIKMLLSYSNKIEKHSSENYQLLNSHDKYIKELQKQTEGLSEHPIEIGAIKGLVDMRLEIMGKVGALSAQVHVAEQLLTGHKERIADLQDNVTLLTKQITKKPEKESHFPKEKSGKIVYEVKLKNKNGKVVTEKPYIPLHLRKKNAKGK